jgi:hypothetical protein
MRATRRRKGAIARAERVAPPRPVTPATVLVHPDVLHVIAGAVQAAGDLETGGPLIGTVQRSWNDDGRPPSLIVSLLGTVPPGPAMRAHHSSVSLGSSADGERAASAIRWWRTVTGLDLVHLGDWHKHHSRTPLPSVGDRMTAKEMCAESAAPIWLAAIAVGERIDEVETGAKDNRVHVARSVADCEQVGFYRGSAAKGLVPIPIQVEADALPSLPRLPWHVADPARFAAECRLLAAAGLRVAIEASESRVRPGLILRLRRAGKPLFTVTTGPDYPDRPPLLHDGNGTRVKANARWSAGRFLVDLLPEAR